MQVLCVHEFLTVLEAWVPQGDLYNKNREMRFDSLCISLHSYLLIRSIFTPLSVSRQREPSAVGSP